MIAAQLLNGLMEGAMLFLMASGLTLIFGVSRVINFAHGSFFMLGAFLGHDIYALISPTSIGGLLAGMVGAGAAVMVVGALCEVLLLRRVYRAEMLLQLLVTVAVVLIVRDIVKLVWGVHMVSTPMPRELAGAIKLGANYLPVYPLAVAAIGLAVGIVTFAVIRFTRTGVLLRATADDPGMVGLLGVNQAHVFTGVFAAGCFLAAMAGALIAPFRTINYLLDTTIIIEAFVVVVIGGLGSLWGALVGAVAFGIVKAFGVLYFERLAMVLIFLVMAAALVVRSLRSEGD